LVKGWKKPTLELVSKVEKTDEFARIVQKKMKTKIYLKM